MIKPLDYYLHVILAAISLLGTQAVQSDQSNTIQCLRPFEGNTQIFGYQVCTESRQITEAETTYTYWFSSGDTLNLTLYPADHEKNLTLSLEASSPEPMFVRITSYDPQNLSRTFERSWDAQYKTGVLTIPGPIQKLDVYIINQSWSKSLTLKIFRHDDLTLIWIIPLAASLGGLVGFTIVALVNYLKERHRRNRERGYIQLQQLAVQEIIDSRFPETKFTQFKSDFSQKACSICLEDMQPDQLCRQLDCQHIFHSHCGSKWLQNQFENMNKTSCPNCNQQVNLVKQEWKDLERGTQ